MADILWGTTTKDPDTSGYNNRTYDQVLNTDFPASRFCKIFFGSAELPDWSVDRLTKLPQHVAPHVCMQRWDSDSAAVAAITAFLDATPTYLSAAPLVPELGISIAFTHNQESDLGNITADENKRRYGILYPAIKAHRYGSLVAVVPIQTNYGTDVNAGNDVSVWWVGNDRSDYPGMDVYGYSWRADYMTPDELLRFPIALADLAGRPIFVPEYGCKYINDPTGTKRGAWITAVTKAMTRSGSFAQVSWWDVNNKDGDFRLLDAPSFQAWSSVFATGGHDVARHVFGLTQTDFAFTTNTVGGVDNVMSLAPSVDITFWNQRQGGQQYTDLAADSAGTTTFDHVTTSDGSDGLTQGWYSEFYGPDEVFWMWAEADGQPRKLVQSRDSGDFAAQLAQLAADLQAHASATGNPHHTRVEDLDNVTLPSAVPVGDVLAKTADGWGNLTPSQVSGAMVLVPPLVSGAWAGNNVDLTTGAPAAAWAAQGPSGLPWTTILAPYSSTDNNPDLLQIKCQKSDLVSYAKTAWANGNGEWRTSPSKRNRPGLRAFEMAQGDGGPSNARFFECSTNPTNTAQREALAGCWGTDSSLATPGWWVMSRVGWAQQGLKSGGTTTAPYNTLLDANWRGFYNGVGAPGSGTWATRDWYIDVTGAIVFCTSGGTPGTWITPNGAGAGYGTPADISSLGTNVSHGTPHAQTATEPGNRVRLFGRLSIGGTITANTTLATLDAGLRPLSDQLIAIRFSGPSAAGTFLQISASTGAISCQAALAATNIISLDDISFIAG